MEPAEEKKEMNEEGIDGTVFVIVFWLFASLFFLIGIWDHFGWQVFLLVWFVSVAVQLPYVWEKADKEDKEFPVWAQRVVFMTLITALGPTAVVTVAFGAAGKSADIVMDLYGTRRQKRETSEAS
jgi:hypothetical protein